jgi:hypothetical protein
VDPDCKGYRRSPDMQISKTLLRNQGKVDSARFSTIVGFFYFYFWGFSLCKFSMFVVFHDVDYF